MTSENLVICQWQSAEQLAARARLDLACRYRFQLGRLDAEFDNFRVSHRWLAKQDSEEAAHLLANYVETLSPYLRQRGLNAELLQWCDEGLQASARLRRNPGWLLLLQSESQNALGRWNEAMSSVQAAIQASRGADASVYARAVLALGHLQFNRGNYKVALDTLTTAEGLLSEIADYEGLATARAEFAAYHLNRKELDQALSLYQEVDQLRKQAGLTEASNHTLLMLGVVYRKKGEFEQAVSHLQQLLEQSEIRGNRGGIATALHHLAWVNFDQGYLAQARRMCGRTIELYQEIGDTRGASDAYEQLGCIDLAQGRKMEAVTHLEQALLTRRQLGNQQGAASTLRHSAVAHFRIGHLIAAARDLWQSLVIYQRLNVLTCRRIAAIFGEFFDRKVDSGDD